MKILLSGYYGFGNVGDEAVLEAIIQGLGSHDISVLSASPQLTKEICQVNAIYRCDWFKIISAMLKTDLFISGGGTLFQNSTSNRSFLYYIGLVLLSKILRKKTVVLAQGFGPLNGIFWRFIARLALNQVDLITLRDEDSLAKFGKLRVNNRNIYITADVAATLKAPSHEEGRKLLSLEGIKKDGRPLLGIALRQLPGAASPEIFERLARLVDWLAAEYNYSPVFVLFQCPQDMTEASKVISFMKENSNVIFRICRPAEMLALISQFDLLIGMRLHSLIFAAMNAVPMLGLSYDPKVAAFMKSIDQPYLVLEKDLDLQKAKDKIKMILENKKNIKVNLHQKGKVLTDKANLNFELLNEYC